MLGKVIAAELRQQLGTPESDCPETEIVAAFYDRALGDSERATWEKHFLTCLRCQEYLAEMARLADADEPPPLLGDEGEKPAEDASPGWFYRLAWVLPFLVIGIASVIWYREDIERYMERHPEMAMKAPEPAPSLPPAETQTAAPGKLNEAGARVEKDLAKSVPAQESPARKAKEEVRRDAPSAARTGSGAASGGSMAPPAARAELADAARPVESTARREVEEKRAVASEMAAAAPKPASAPAESVPTGGEGRSSGFGAMKIGGLYQKATTAWRVGPRGLIQKADGQGGWTRVPSGVQDDLFGITFAGTTGWAVGHEGTVLRSADGGHTWQKVTPPTTEDLTGVSSVGPQQASVFTRSGKTFTTTDGGQTWK
jgi:hypothetical protein